MAVLTILEQGGTMMYVILAIAVLALGVGVERIISLYLLSFLGARKLSEEVAQRFLAFLGLLGNVATLRGLLGTIFGLILAFSGVSAASAADRQAVLAEGISVAMYTTAFGIVAAVPVLFLHNILVSRSEKILVETEEGATRLMAALGRRLRVVSRDKNDDEQVA